MIPASAVFCLASFAHAAQVQPVKAVGRWYPSEPAKLNTLLDRAFAMAEERADLSPPRPKLRALIVPHAGLEYSGVAAASAYRLIGKPRTIILLAFSHRSRVDGVAAPGVDAYDTPLGPVRVSRPAIESFGVPVWEGDPVADHSLENQLPFLRRIAPQAVLVPMYVGELDGDALDTVARRLADRMRQGDLVIASSDFTHYGQGYRYTPFPNDDGIREKLSRLASRAFEEIGSLQVGAFDRHLTGTGDTICGRQPIRLLMAALAHLEEDVYPHLADYMTSSDLTGDWTASVGYGALAFYPSSAFEVGAGEQKKLLASARTALDRLLVQRAAESVAAAAKETSAVLNQRTSVFVTVRKDGKLRGCVGALSPRQPIWELVPDRTVAASSADERFPPVTAGEGPLQIEISLLTPLKKLDRWEHFRTGYGAVLVVGGKGGILLPQVAAEHGWGADEFLANLARKAGLPPEAYKEPGARLYIYQAQVFAEQPDAAANGVP